MPFWAVAALLMLAAALSWVSTPLVLRFARRHRAFDPPDARKIHTRQVPRLGGVPVFIALSLTLTIGLLLAQYGLINLPLYQSRLIPAIYLGLCGFFFIGFFDDLRSLPALPRLLAQIGVAYMAVELSGGGLRISSLFGRPLELPEWVFVAITVLWIVGIVNTFNWIDGLDGLASGVAGIAALAFLLLAMLTPGQPNAALVIVLAATLVGALAGFMPFNFFPARIFIGDGGAFSLGYLLAVISIVGLFKQAAVIGFLLPVTVLALPIADTAFAILRRVLRGQSPVTPDNKHIHHRMLALLSRRYRERLPREQLSRIEEKFIQRRAHRDTVLWLYAFTVLCAATAIWLGVAR